MLTTEIKEFILKQKLCFVATVCDDGTPNLSPKATTRVWDDDHIMFADIHSPGTVGNLLKRPAIEINMVDVFTRKGYRFKGNARVFSKETELFREAIAAYGDSATKYDIKHIVMVKIESVQPVWSPAYDDGTTEEEITKKWVEYWGDLYH